MEKAEATLARLAKRVGSLRVAIRLLEHERDRMRHDKQVVLDRLTFESVLHTIEAFVEDVEGATGGTGGAPVERRSVETLRPQAARAS